MSDLFKDIDQEFYFDVFGSEEELNEDNFTYQRKQTT